jgi:hypothetical protein
MGKHRVTMCFEGVATFYGTDEQAAERWRMIVAVLRAMDCVRVVLRETDYPERSRDVE